MIQRFLAALFVAALATGSVAPVVAFAQDTSGENGEATEVPTEEPDEPEVAIPLSPDPDC